MLVGCHRAGGLSFVKRTPGAVRQGGLVPDPCRTAGEAPDDFEGLE